VAGISVRHRPNVLFNLIGVLLIVGGIGITIYGIAYGVQIMRGFDPFRGDSPPVKIADGMALAFWGIIIFTMGRYFWRGARKRGLRDRFGRFLIISGYALLGVALDNWCALRCWPLERTDGGVPAINGRAHPAHGRALGHPRSYPRPHRVQTGQRESARHCRGQR